MDQSDTTMRKWQARPGLARALRTLIFVAPLVVSLLLVLFVGQLYPRPKPWAEALLWWVGLSIFATLVVLALDRVFRKLLPVVALFKLSLIFPDKAPPRYKAALRSGTVRQLQRQMAQGEFSAVAPQKAAEQLVGLSAALNAHDRQTRGHTERVRAYSVMIGTELGLDKEELEFLNWSGLIHDIGKLAVPSEILNKPGKPTDEEWVVLKSHPAMADELVEPLRPWLGDWAESATQHHERYDGKGYPNGLTGKNTTLAGRIVAVADAYDVMTSTRSYKKPMPIADAREELAVNAGTQFDPAIVRAFLGISIGRFQVVAGPLASLVKLPAGGATVGSAVSTGVTTVSALALAALTGLLNPPIEGPPQVVAMTAADDISVDGFEDEELSIQLTGSAGQPGANVTLSVPDHGIAELGDDAVVTFSPDADFNGTTVLPYTVCVDDNNCDQGTITIHVGAVNDAPTAVEDFASTDEDSIVRVPVLQNDFDVDGDDLEVVGVTVVQHPDHQLVPSGLRFGETGIIVEPAPNAFGEVLLEYTISDPSGVVATSTLLVSFLPVNDAPEAVDDSASVGENLSMVLDVLANDTDVDGDSLTISSLDSVVGGKVLTEGKKITFIPRPRYIGPASFSYSIVDPSGASSSAQVLLDIVGDPSRPTLQADPVFSLEDQTVIIDVLQNDSSKAALDPSTLEVVTAPENGTATVTSGLVSYSPNPNWNGNDDFTYFVCDIEDFCDTARTTITTGAVNDAPQFVVGAGISVPENSGVQVIAGWLTGISPGPVNEQPQSVSFTVTVSDPSLFVSPPAIDQAGTLTFELAPNTTGSATVTVIAQDDGGTINGGVDSSAPGSGAITVFGPTDDPPVANDDGGGAAFSTLEDNGLTTPDVTGNDTDPEDGTVVPGTALVTATTINGVLTNNGDGTFAYTPDPDFFGTDTFTYTVTDSVGQVSNAATVTLIVDPVNDPPALGAIGPQSSDELTAITFTAGATDGDVPANTLTYTLAGTVPAGAAINPTSGDFAWTPTEAQDGVHTFDVVVTDDGTPNLAGSETITVTVNDVNNAPSLGAIGPQAGDELTAITFTAGATDSDMPANTLTYTLAGTVPAGAAINPTTGDFAWTPTEAQDGLYTFDVVVTDDGPGNLTDAETINVTVNEANVGPALGAIGPQSGDELTAITFPAGATDSDVPANTLTYTLAGTVPAGAAINPTTGDFAWTPTEAQDGVHTFDVVVTDDGTPNLADSETITVTVNDVNVAPSLGAIGPQSGDELTAITFTAGATDPDLPANALTYTLAGIVPAGAAINPTTGDFAWTPTEAQDGVHTFDVVVTDDGTPNLADSETINVTVNDVNDAPSLGAIGAQAGDELTTITFTAGATDSDMPANTLTYTLAGTVPAGAAINPTTGDFAWTPTEAQDGLYTFDVVVTDDGTPNLADSETIAVTVNEVNDPPALGAIGPQGGDELTAITFTAGATDGDVPANTLTYTLAGTVPAGAAINPTSGDFAWTPTEAQDGVHTFDVVVTDDGTPNLADTETITVTVNDVNNAPSLGAIGPQGGDELTAITFTAGATDSDMPANTLTYTLAGTVPAGAAINPTTGDFAWTPTEAQDGLYTFDVVVTDDGTPSLADSETINVTVNEANVGPALGAIGPQSGDELTAITFTAGATDGDVPANTLTYTLAGTVPAGAAINPTTGDFAWTPTEAQDGVHTFDVVVTDDGTPNLAGSETITVTVNEVPSVADAGGPYVIDEGDTLVLDGSASTGPATSWNWDLDNDGSYDDATGENPSVPWATLAALGVDDDGVYPIGLETDGGADIAAASLTINNVAPLLNTSGAASVLSGSPFTLNLAAVDPGNDTIVSWTINWGDGTIQTILGNPASVTHTYTREGFTFDILASATDEDGTFLQNELLVPSYNGDTVFRFEQTTGDFLQVFATGADPSRTLVGPDGRLYVSGQLSNDVRRYDAETGLFIDQFVTSGSGGLTQAEGLAFGPDGNLYVGDYLSNRVLRFDGATGAYIDVFATTGLTRPYDVLFGPDSNLYVGNYTTNEVIRLNGTTGAFIDTFVTAASGGLNSPEQMTFGPDGNLYVSSLGTDQVLRYNGTSGAFIDIFVAAGGVGDLDQPTGLAFGPDGHLYVGDYLDHAILRFDGTSGSFIDIYVTPGSGGLTRPASMTFLAATQVNTVSTSGLVISEYAAAGVNPSGDFVEIHNSSNSVRPLDGITLHISDHTSEVDSFTIAIPGVDLSPGEFYLLAESSTGVASSSDNTFAAALPISVGLELRTSGGVVIDAVGTRASPELTVDWFFTDSVYGEGVHLPAFDLASSIPESFSRIAISGGICQDTDNNSADFIHNFAPGMVTPRNRLSGPGPCSPPQPPLTKPNHLVISEFRTDGPGSGQNDFVNIYNPTGAPVDLRGWQLEFALDGTYTVGEFDAVTDFTLNPGATFLAAGPTWSGSFDEVMPWSPKNTDEIRLKDPGGAVIDEVHIGGNTDDLPKLSRRGEHSYSRRYGCSDTDDWMVDFEHLFLSTPRTRSMGASPC